MELRPGSCNERNQKEDIRMDDVRSLAHTKWNCKYHVVFAPKYRRKVFYEEKRLEIGAILRELCRWKGVEIIEAEVCPDHIHPLSIPIPASTLVPQYILFPAVPYYQANLIIFIPDASRFLLSFVPCRTYSSIWILLFSL